MRPFVLMCLVALLSVTAYAGKFDIMAENDVIYHTDHYYTHATRLEYTGDNGIDYSIGQNMYTPDDKKATYLLPEDRPYAGYLYGSAYETVYSESGDEISGELQLGTTGPHAYAGETQNWIHEHIGSAPACGWSNQIPNHFAFMLIGKYTTHVLSSKYFSVDPYAELAAGNVMDYIGVGFNVFAGYDLPQNRNDQRIIPIKACDGGFNPYAYVFAGIEPKYVPYNMFLEDHRFDIEMEHYVCDRNLGVVLGCRYFELSFTLCMRTKEFDKQIEAEQFGSAKIQASF